VSLPTPTLRAVAWLGAATGLGLLAAAWGELQAGVAALDLLWLGAVLVDGARGRGARLDATRTLPVPLRAFSPNAVTLSLHNRLGRALSGELSDALPPGAAAPGHRARFRLQAGESQTLTYALQVPRGTHRFGDVHLSLEGPWGLVAWPRTAPAAVAVAAVPDLSDGEGLTMARPQAEAGLARLRRLGEGREVDALRAYRPGDDVRQVDWKASARRGELVSREYTPEKNQVVLLLLDCGRQMVVREGARTRLDLAIDAALRLARASLDKGDAVGLVAFGTQVHAFVPPQKGRAHLKRLLDACVPLQPELEEADYALAFDLVQRRQLRRALICVFGDVGDEDTSRVLLSRLLALRPRHLPLLVALLDAELDRLARTTPATPDEAFAQAAAQRLLDERARALGHLQHAGAQVVSVRSDALRAAALNAYLRIKARGLL
jgi:uncharacterized protein (DUF58 family)